MSTLTMFPAFAPCYLLIKDVNRGVCNTARRWRPTRQAGPGRAPAQAICC